MRYGGMKIAFGRDDIAPTTARVHIVTTSFNMPTMDGMERLQAIVEVLG